MKNAPKRIYLTVGKVPDDVDFKDLSEVTWSDQREGGSDIEYVRSDMIRQRIKQLEAQLRKSEVVDLKRVECKLEAYMEMIKHP